jgi:hypothetical protein
MTEVTKTRFSHKTGQTLKRTVYPAWNVKGEPEKGIWIDLLDNEDGDGEGIHITADELAEMGFYEEKS